MVKDNGISYTIKRFDITILAHQCIKKTQPLTKVSRNAS
uniref:Uncharacterized protein n=1 Tax=Rhizophora mucronata TaxID=61149 RepID=A0A2P2PPK6_RHIMU